MSDLHAQIMNIPCDRPDTSAMGKATAYKLGHRDARHAAAEMALSSATPTLSAAMQLPEVRALRDAAIALMEDFKIYKFNSMGDFYYSSKDRQFAPMTAALAPFTEASA